MGSDGGSDRTLVDSVTDRGPTGHSGAVTNASHRAARTGTPWDEPAPTIEQLYELHFDFIWRSLRRLGVPDGALDDAVQEVFITAYHRLESFEGRSSVRSWLFGIAIHVAQRSYRTARRRPDRALEEVASLGTSQGPHDAAEHAEAIRLVYELLDGLDLDRRAIFVLAELEEMTGPEIADALGVELNTVYSRLRAARRDFNSALARHRARDRWRQP